MAAASFGSAFFAMRARNKQVVVAPQPVARDAPDSIRLASVGIRPGPQLVVYVFATARCGYCQQEDTRQAFAAIRPTLRRVYGARYPKISVIAVAATPDVEEGLAYLRKLGVANFDEISAGNGWQNAHITQLIRREKFAEAAVPLVIVLTRSMSATARPTSLTFTPDSLITVVQGHAALLEWVGHGAPLVRTGTASAATAPPHA